MTVWMPTTHMLEQYCPSCGAILDAATAPFGDTAPEPQDLTVCMYCLAALQWDYRMQLEIVTRETLDALPTEALIQILRIQQTIRELKTQRN